MAQHDGSWGSAQMRLERLADHRTIATKTMEGTWTLLTYVPAAHEFVLGGEFEVGAWLPLNVISFVDEATGAVRHSRYNGVWMAFAAVPSPDGRFIALVGALDQSRPFRLEVLDIVNDALYELGPPPAPPPDSAPITKGFDGGWDWGDPIDGLTPMDASIITFPDDHTLRVTYGRDTSRRRARHRTARTWDLAQVVANQRPAKPVRERP
ncbi:MAG: hypothetical protein ABUS79_14475 [Pseudomonadota bacterium]